MIRLIAILLIQVFATVPVVAETWSLGSLPTVPTKLGFTVTVDAEAVNCNGYQPIHLNFSANGKSFGRDRYVELRFTAQEFNQTNFEFTFRKKFTLPETASLVGETIYVPHYYGADRFRIELLEDGRQVEGGMNRVASSNTLRHKFAGQKTTVGIVRPRDAKNQDAPWKTFPDVRTLVTVLGDGPIPTNEDSSVAAKSVADRLDHGQSIALAQQVQPARVQFRIIDEDKLCDNWLGYSQLDVIIVPAPLIDRIENQKPTAIEAFRLWLAAGGNLWLYSTNENDRGFSSELLLSHVSPQQVLKPSAIDRLLDLSARNDTSDLVGDRWLGAVKRSEHYSYRGEMENFSLRQSAFDALMEAEHEFAATLPAPQLALKIRQADFGLGQVIAIDDPDPFPGSYQLWKSIHLLQGSVRLHWVERNGVDVPKANASYWSWLIGSLGQPPVRSFVVLNLLFALIVGPVCYFYLRKRQRLYLLYFVAPTAALLATAGLFTYALVSDGITTKQRTRQITWVDSVNQYHTTQSRTTYYRVLGYGQQINVSADTAVYPIRHQPIEYNYYSRGNEGRLRGTLSSTDDRQAFDGGFLPIRDQVQYMMTRPIAATDSIEFDFEASEVTWQVTNQLPTMIDQILVHDRDGQCWQAENLTSGKATSLTRCEDIQSRLNSMLPMSVISGNAGDPQMQYYSSPKNNLALESSLLETRLRRWSKQLPRGCVIGIAEIDPSRSGIADAETIDSVQIIMGKLP